MKKSLLTLILFYLIIYIGNAQKRPLVVCYADALSQTTISAGAEGGPNYITVTTRNNCTSYLVSEVLDWVSWTKSGLTVTVNVASNSGPARSGEISIGEITVSIFQSCGNYPATAGTISGTGSVCPGQSGVGYSVGSISNATGYSWSLPSGASIASGNNTNSITVNYSTGASSGNITVSGTGCGTGNSSPNYGVTVNTLGQPGGITGDSPVCAGGTYPYSISAVSGANSYFWSIPSGASGSSTTNTIYVTFGSSSGTISVVAHNSAGCTSATSTLAVGFNTYTIFSMTGGGSTCPGTNIPIRLSGSTYGVHYRLYFNDVWQMNKTQDGNGAVITWNESAAGTYTVKADVNSCIIPMEGSITITNPSYSTNPTGISASPNPMCLGAGTNLTVNGGFLGSGASWKWYVGDCTGTSVHTGSSYSVNPLTTTTYCVRGEGTCNQTSCVPITITVIGYPTITQQPQNVTICDGAPTSFSVSATGAISYQWQTYINTTWTNVSGATNTTYSISSTTGMNGQRFRCIVTGSCNFVTNSSEASITISTLPKSMVSGTGSICPGYSKDVILEYSVPDSRIWYTCYRDGAVVIPPKQGTGGQLTWTNNYLGGVYVVKAVTLDGCTVQMDGSAIITVLKESEHADSIHASPATLCLGGSSTLSVCGGSLQEGSGSWVWYSGGLHEGYGSSIVVTPPETTTYSVHAEGGCSTSQYSYVTVIVKYSASITTQPVNTTVLVNHDASFNVIATGTNLRYIWQSSTTGDGSWTTLSGLPAENFQTPTLTIKGSEAFQNDYYRCQITSDCDMIYSDVVKLTTVYPEVEYLENSEIPDPDNRSINTSLEVGSIQGNQIVTQLGGLAYSIPLFCSPGTNGVQPGLSLQYNSQTGNGLLGWGWNLGGLSSVSRIVKPYYIDHEIKSIDLSSDDQFAIDGNRLVLHTGSQGLDGSVYNTELETFSTTTVHGSSGNGPEWFEVYNNKNGSTAEYGNSVNAYIENSQQARFNWYLTKYKDINGNYIKYNYSKEATSGLIYLSSIQYTGNENQTLEPYNEILFKYVRRSDSFKSYLMGTEFTNSLLVSRIIVNCDGSPARTYDFNYIYNTYSFLVAIKESASDNTSYNSTIFKYDYPTQNSYTNSDLTTTFKNKFVFADFNGDGKSDMAVIPNKTEYTSSDKIKIYFNQNGTDFQLQQEIPINTYALKLNSHRTEYFGHFNGGNAVDFNGDGLSDFYTVETRDFSYDPEYRGKPDETHNLITIYYSDGSTLNPNFPEYLQKDWSMFPADIDGDGRADEFRFAPDGDAYEIMFANGSGISGNSNVGANYTTNTGPIDFNGDGKDEVFSIEESGWLHIYGLNSGQFTELISATPFDFGDYCLGDINGDGKTDIFAYNYGECKIFFSNGKGFNIVDFNSHSFTNDKEYFHVADFNGDGKSDIVQIKRSSVIETYNGLEVLKWYFTEPFYLFTYNGNSFSMETINVSLAQSNLVYDADFNGDGENELYFRKQYGNWYIPYPTDESLIFRIRPDNKSRLLSTVTNGLNNKLTITYAALPKTGSYSKSTNSFIYPVCNLTLPIYLVENIKTFGSGKTTPYSNINYSYQDLMVHMQGKGLVGFSKFTSEDLISLTKSETTYSIGATTLSKKFVNVYPSNIKQYIKNILVSEISNTEPLIHPFDAENRYFSYIPSSLTEDKVKNIAAELSTTIDDLGNLTSKLTKAKTSGGTIVSQVSESYPSYNDFGEPLNTTITSTRGTESISRSITYEYYDNGLLNKETKSFVSFPSIITSYTYDGFGNVLSNLITSGTETRVNTYTYEPVKARFLKTKTNTINHTMSYDYNPGTGNVTQVEDHTSLITSYVYNGFGRKVETHLPDNLVIYNHIDWSINALGIGELYYSESEADHKPTSFTYFDFLGRELRSKSQSFDGTYLVTDNVYDEDGRLNRSYLPYFEGDPSDQYIEYSYDDINRIHTETVYPAETVTTYTYGDLTTTIEKGGHTYTKVFDASGLLESITDPGGTIDYNYNAEGKTAEIISPSGSTSIEYDDYGYQHILNDIDAKITTYEYNGFGELTGQTDAVGNHVSVHSDNLGRIDHKEWTEGETINYTYDPASELLSNISSPGSTQTFTYDDYYRIESKTETTDNNTFTSVYSYDSYGNKSREVINSNVTLDYIYNDYGFLDQVKANDQLVWNANSLNKNGQIDNYTLGNNSNTAFTYDANGFVDKKETKIGSTWIQNWDYNFDPIQGNLERRIGINQAGSFLEETFGYDNLNRLTTHTVGNNFYENTYDAEGKGNILTRTGIGTYNYSLESVHKLDSITNLSGYESGLADQEILYTKFNKISSLTHTMSEETRQLSFTYGPDEERVKTVYTLNGSINKTKYYALGKYEKEIAADNSIRELYYISTPTGIAAILTNTNSQTSLYYVHTDILGSLDVITDSVGTVVDRLSFDPWGRRRNANDWTYTNIPQTFLFDRGFTGHEHLDQFDLINMNGRVYDPQLAMFVSPDKYVQSADNTQNFNRYTYCLNNPLIYTDPSGDFFFATLASMFCPILAPIGTVIDGALWSAAADASIQGIKMAFGLQSRFNMPELLGSAAGGATATALSFAAPGGFLPASATGNNGNYSFMDYLSYYSSKAAYTSKSAMISSFVGNSVSSSLSGNNQDFSSNMIKIGAASYLSSFAYSVFNYFTWDRLSISDRIGSLEKEFSGTQINHVSTLDDYASTNRGALMTDMPDFTFETRARARLTMGHEQVHVMDAIELRGKGISNLQFEMYSESRAYINESLTQSKYGISMNDWLISSRFFHKGGQYSTVVPRRYLFIFDMFKILRNYY